MAQWTENATLDALLPSEVADVIDVAITTTETASSILGTISTGLDVVSSFLQAVPALDWTKALLALVDELKNNYLGAGFYYLPLWDYGLDFQYRLARNPEYFNDLELTVSSSRQGAEEGFAGFVDEINRSYDDEADFSRPTFVSGGVTAGLCLVTGAPTFAELTQAFESIALLFSNDAWIAALLRAMRSTLFPAEVEAIATPPNWSSYTVRDMFPDFNALIERDLAAILSALQTGLNAVDALVLLIDTIKRKVDQLNRLIGQVNTSLQNFENILGAAGIWSCYIETGDGVDGLQQELSNAVNTPDWGAQPFISGAMFVAGGPDVEPFRNLFGVLAA